MMQQSSFFDRQSWQGRQAVRGALVVLTAACWVVPLGARADTGKASQSANVWATAPPPPSATETVNPTRRASFGQEKASLEARHVGNWVIDSADNQGMPFMIIDKIHARVMMFDATGQLQGAAPALLGLARGDDSAPGIGQRKLSSIRPDERTTPAGRFVASLDRDMNGKEMLWVDYETAISLHPVVKGTPAERRSQRLDSATPDDNRISYGCINVPLKFYELFVSSAFTGTNGIVYILPETRTAQEVFGSYEVKNLSVVTAKP